MLTQEEEKFLLDCIPTDTETGAIVYQKLGGKLKVQKVDFSSLKPSVDTLLEAKKQYEKSSYESQITVASLEANDYFGELALLQENSIRTATAVASEHCALLGLFKPDMDELLDRHPQVAAKFIKSISMLLANRISNVTSEIKTLKLKIELLEKNATAKIF